MKKPALEPSQHQRFVEAARELGTDESEKRFNAALKKVATAPPPEPKPKKQKPAN